MTFSFFEKLIIFFLTSPFINYKNLGAPGLVVYSFNPPSCKAFGEVLGGVGKPIGLCEDGKRGPPNLFVYFFI